jgi:hypothetical protein
VVRIHSPLLKKDAQLSVFLVNIFPDHLLLTEIKGSPCKLGKRVCGFKFLPDEFMLYFFIAKEFISCGFFYH